jgi:hypothetical protein
MVSLPGVRTHDTPASDNRTSFRSSWTQTEGAVGAHVIEGQIVDVNLEAWTVDFISKYDQKYYLNIQVGSPYAHFSRGEGFYAMPDLGAKCYVCIPSDGPPPFVLSFVMPQETIDDPTSDDAPAGTNGQSGGPTQTNTSVTFAGGRSRVKPGDIGITNRDGSFVRLHRGGVLQIGSTQLAQRLYIPVQNLITDISQNYRHYNTGGSHNWFINLAESEDNPPTVSRHTYQLRQGDEKATVRVSIGKLSDVITEPSTQAQSDLATLGFGEEPIVCEVIIAPDSINTADGATTKTTRAASKLRYFFDKDGNTHYRTEGSVNLRIAGRMRLRVADEVEMFGRAGFQFIFEGVGRLEAKGGLDLSGAVIRLNGGRSKVATVGSVVRTTLDLPVPITVVVGGVPGTGFIVAGATMTGVVTTGTPTVLA